MVTVKQSFTHTLGTSLPLLYSLNSAEVSQTKLQLTFSAVLMNQPITWLHNCVTTFAVTSSCSDITGELIPGSPPTFWYFVGMRGEPGNELGCFWFSVYPYLFEISQEAFGVMLTLLEQLNLCMSSVIGIGFLYRFVKDFLEKLTSFSLLLSFCFNNLLRLRRKLFWGN